MPRNVGCEYLIEAVKFIDDWNKERGNEALFHVVCDTEGVRIKGSYKVGERSYTQENVTAWNAVQSGQQNPLARAFNDLLGKVREHQNG